MVKTHYHVVCQGCGNVIESCDEFPACPECVKAGNPCSGPVKALCPVCKRWERVKVFEIREV